MMIFINIPWMLLILVGEGGIIIVLQDSDLQSFSLQMIFFISAV